MKSIDQPAIPGWGWALSHDPAALVALVEHGKARLWLEALLRAADRRLGGTLSLPKSVRNVAPCWLPGNVIPVVGARSQSEGVIGTLHFAPATDSIATTHAHAVEPGGVVMDSAEVIVVAASLALESLVEFTPEATVPHIRADIAGCPAGDSMALPAAMAAILHTFGCPWPEDLVASGGLSSDLRSFVPVPLDSLEAKARAARNWGYRRIVLIEDPNDSRTAIEGLEVVRFPKEAGALPLAIASLDEVDLEEEHIARALAVFDLRIGRAGPQVHDRVLAVTASMMQLESPIVRHIAEDMRSRIHLHAGRTTQSRESLARADSLRGQGPMPDGRLRDVLRYQQPAHRSVVHIDLGEWEDELPAHRGVDHLIDEIDALWATRHERLMRLFLANTRARRQEYLGRLHSDSARFDRAWTDLMNDREDWGDLIDSFAVGELHLPDTSRARIENQLIDVAFSRYQLEKSIPSEWTETVSGFGGQQVPKFDGSSEPILVFEKDGVDTLHLGGNGFDLLSRFKRHRLLDRPGLPDEVVLALECDRCRTSGPLPYPWFHWLELAATEARRQGGELPLPGADSAQGAATAWGFVLSDPRGISAVIALRSIQFLVELGVEIPDLAPPPAGSAIGRLHEDLASDPPTLLRRTPY
ncbi:MAG: hypothetical protein VX641_02060 [Planctomycetota bacterium]|nr:hypothetical protein [Planctomycetota bacterium]